MVRNFIEANIIKPLEAKFRASRQHVSRGNRLVHSYMYGIDDHLSVSPNNRLIHANFGDLDLSAPVADKKP